MLSRRTKAVSWLRCLSGLRRGYRPWGGVGRGSWLSLLLSVLVGFGIFQATPMQAAAEFSLPPLPYSANALEPAVDARTMKIHHDLHHGAYVANLNAQIPTFPELASADLTTLQGSISKYSAAVRNNGGGHYNHSLFWAVMAPAGKGGQPSADLAKAIKSAFGSKQAMQQQFNQAASTTYSKTSNNLTTIT